MSFPACEGRSVFGGFRPLLGSERYGSPPGFLGFLCCCFWCSGCFSDRLFTSFPPLVFTTDSPKTDKVEEVRRAATMKLQRRHRPWMRATMWPTQARGKRCRHGATSPVNGPWSTIGSQPLSHYAGMEDSTRKSRAHTVPLPQLCTNSESRDIVYRTMCGSSAGKWNVEDEPEGLENEWNRTRKTPRRNKSKADFI